MNVFFKNDRRLNGGQERRLKRVAEAASNIFFTAASVLLGVSFCGLLKLLGIM